MEFVIATITYRKNDKLQILESPFLDSLESQIISAGIVPSLVIAVNSEYTDKDAKELALRIQKLYASKSIKDICILNLNYPHQVPVARNEVLTYLAFNYPDCHFIFPDDDDKFYNRYSLNACLRFVEEHPDEINPVLFTFNGLRGNVMPDNRRVIPNPSSVYQECAGYFNWNAIYSIKYFVSNHLSFPEYLNPPHRSHDTLIDLKSMSIMKGKKYKFLANMVMDYKYPEGANTLSTRTKRPDTPIFDIMEWLYESNDAKQVGDIYLFDPDTDKVSIIDHDTYRGLRFRDADTQESIRSQFKDKKFIVDLMGKLFIGNISVIDYQNKVGIDKVYLMWEGISNIGINQFRLVQWGLIKDLKNTNLYRRYLSVELPEKNSVDLPDGDFDDYMYVVVK